MPDQSFAEGCCSVPAAPAWLFGASGLSRGQWGGVSSAWLWVSTGDSRVFQKKISSPPLLLQSQDGGMKNSSSLQSGNRHVIYEYINPRCISHMRTKRPGKYLKIRASSGETQKASTKRVSLNSLFLSWAGLVSVDALTEGPAFVP